MMDRREEDLLKNQTLERKALPKRIRQEMRAREMMFRESMRISTPNIHEMLKPTEEKERIKKVRVRSQLSKVCTVGLHSSAQKFIHSLTAWLGEKRKTGFSRTPASQAVSESVNF